MDSPCATHILTISCTSLSLLQPTHCTLCTVKYLSQLHFMGIPCMPGELSTFLFHFTMIMENLKISESLWDWKSNANIYAKNISIASHETLDWTQPFHKYLLLFSLAVLLLLLITIILIIISILITINLQITVLFLAWLLDSSQDVWMFVFVLLSSYAHKGSIYLIKNTVKAAILWNVITI